MDLYFTFTGTITNGIDVQGLFGLGDGASLAGQTYSLIYTVNTDNSNAQALGYGTGWSSFFGAGSPLGSSTMLIGNFGVTIDGNHWTSATLYSDPADHGSLFSYAFFAGTLKGVDHQYFGPNMPLTQTTPYMIAADPSSDNSGDFTIIETTGNAAVIDANLLAAQVSMSLTAPDLDSVIINSARAAPEPSTWILMLIGLIVAAVCQRKRSLIVPSS